MRNKPKNFEAVKNWTKENRPDCYPYLVNIMESGRKEFDGINLLMMLAFEAGREFQQNLPDPSINHGAMDY